MHLFPQAAWRDKIAESLIHSPWGANEAAADKITERHKKELKEMRLAHEQRLLMLKGAHAERRALMHKINLQEVSKARADCKRKVYQIFHGTGGVDDVDEWQKSLRKGTNNEDDEEDEVGHAVSPLKSNNCSPNGSRGRSQQANQQAGGWMNKATQMGYHKLDATPPRVQHAGAGTGMFATSAFCNIGDNSHNGFGDNGNNEQGNTNSCHNGNYSSVAFSPVRARSAGVAPSRQSPRSGRHMKSASSE